MVKSRCLEHFGQSPFSGRAQALPLSHHCDISELKADAHGIDGDSGTPQGGHDATPVCITAEQRRFDQVGCRDRLRNLLGLTEQSWPLGLGFARLW